MKEDVELVKCLKQDIAASATVTYVTPSLHHFLSQGDIKTDVGLEGVTYDNL